jgi:hypothetical protein
MANRKKKRSKRPGQAQQWQIEYLLFGFYTVPGGQRSIRKGLGLLYGEPAPTPWGEVRDDLLPKWIMERPGSRPWAWWQEEAPEPRREDESELEFLCRHGLLTPQEKRRLGV